MTWLSAEIIFLLFDHKGKQLHMGSVTDLVQSGLEFLLESDVWFWSVLQVVGTRIVLYVFSQNLERPLTFGSSGLQCSETIPGGFAALVCFVLFGGLVLHLESRSLDCRSHVIFLVLKWLPSPNGY